MKRNQRYEIDFESLELTEAEKTSLLLKILEEGGLKVVDKHYGSTPEEFAKNVFESMDGFVGSAPQKVVVELIRKIQNKRKAQREYLKSVENQAALDIMQIEDLDTDLLKAVKRVWL